MEHQFINGRDGIGYHCRNCGISKTGDYYGHGCEEYQKDHPMTPYQKRKLRSRKEQEKWANYWYDLYDKIYSNTGCALTRTCKRMQTGVRRKHMAKKKEYHPIQELEVDSSEEALALSTELESIWSQESLLSQRILIYIASLIEEQNKILEGFISRRGR